MSRKLKWNKFNKIDFEEGDEHIRPGMLVKNSELCGGRVFMVGELTENLDDIEYYSNDLVELVRQLLKEHGVYGNIEGEL